jgi:hypothetical protein
MMSQKNIKRETRNSLIFIFRDKERKSDEKIEREKKSENSFANKEE